MKQFIIGLFVLLGSARYTYAQVDEVKAASKTNSSNRDSSPGGSSDRPGGSTGSVGVGLDVFVFLFEGLGSLHTTKIKSDRERYPCMSSFDVSVHGALQPSNYYVLQPRLRGNWGLFSTDIRLNYLIEDDIVEGYKHIRTTDWQILQLNLITSRFLTLRVGTGFMHEAFGANRYFNESSVMFNVHAPDQTKLIGFEFRFAKDWETGSTPRREVNIQYQHQVFQASALHGYLSLGGLYQRYYNTIDVWGIQTGLVFRFF